VKLWSDILGKEEKLFLLHDNFMILPAEHVESDAHADEHDTQYDQEWQNSWVRRVNRRICAWNKKKEEEEVHLVP
jgi:hypothetical protein